MRTRAVGFMSILLIHNLNMDTVLGIQNKILKHQLGVDFEIGNAGQKGEQKDDYVNVKLMVCFPIMNDW